MRLFNTLTRSRDEFTVNGNKIRMYVCGPTVYNYFHIGNARCFVMFDALRRYFEHKGYEVDYILNFTDVDDKLIKRAKEENTTVNKIADKYINEFFTDMRGLGIHEASHNPKATENINEIIEIISSLIQNNNAYSINGNVYFDTSTCDGYGKLSHYNIEELEAGARIEISEEKRHPFDFALWKAKKEPGEISWDSPWGEGRPGWHIECSAMINKYLGTEIDIHCGGVDLIFPHHENEIAQSECATGKTLARFWLHNGHINIDNKKMSKSKGKTYWVRDLSEEYGYQVLRYFLISAHYNVPVNFSEDILDQAKSALERLHNCYENIEFARKNNKEKGGTDSEVSSLAEIEKKESLFFESLDDDFNTADAVSYLFEIAREINRKLKEGELSSAYLDKVFETFNRLLVLLGLEPKNDEAVDEAAINGLVEARHQAKVEKRYSDADNIREKLKEMGILLEDTPNGTKWKKT